MIDRGLKQADGFRWFFELIAPHRVQLGLAGLALTGAGGITLVLPRAAGKVVDAAMTTRDLHELDAVIYWLFVLFALAGVLSFCETFLLRRTAAHIVLGLRSRLHAHLLSLSPSFFESQRTGELLSRLGADIDQIGWALTHDLANGLQQILVFLGALAVLMVMHVKLTCVMLVAVPALAISAAIFGKKLERIAKKQQGALAHSAVVAEEGLSGIRTVQAFACEPFERARYHAALDATRRLAERAALAWGAFGGTMLFFIFAVLAIMLLYGGRLVIAGELSAGQLTSFLLYMLSIGSAITSLTHLYATLKTALGATDRVRSLLATHSSLLLREALSPLPRARGHVIFQNVTFAYARTENTYALRNISTEVIPGQFVAVVGPSGAGKSTLAALLLRFYDPDSGTILLDGVDIKAYVLADLRRAIGHVPQEVFLFGGTVEENIRYGRPDADEAEIIRAAQAAQAHEFIHRLPEKYATPIGERGMRLSAGERQRIAIARVFLKDPGLVILDEATSALDAHSEAEVQKAIEHLLENRTTFVIAHRLATVRRADRVLVLEEGQLVAAGSHPELLVRSPLYRHLCELQMLTPKGVPATSVGLEG